MAEQAVEQTKFPLLAKAMGEEVKAEVAPEVVAPVVIATPTPGVASPEVIAAEPVVAKPNYDELSDEELLKITNKRFGTSYKSVDEIKPVVAKSKEEIEAENEKFKKDAFNWAVGSGRVKLDDYNKSISEKEKNSRDIALSIFGAQLRLEDAKITNEEIEETFIDTFHEGQMDDNPRLYKIGQNQIASMADGYRSQINSKVEGYEDDYKNVQQVQSRATNYGKQVKTLFEDLAAENNVEIEYEVTPGKTEKVLIPYSLDKTDMDSVRKQFLSDDMFLAYGADKDDVDVKKLQAGVEHHLNAKTFKKVLAQVAKKSAETANLNMEAYLKGIKNNPAPTLQGNLTIPVSRVTEPNQYPLLRKAQAQA